MYLPDNDQTVDRLHRAAPTGRLPVQPISADGRSDEIADAGESWHPVRRTRRQYLQYLESVFQPTPAPQLVRGWIAAAPGKHIKIRKSGHCCAIRAAERPSQGPGFGAKRGFERPLRGALLLLPENIV